MRLIDADATIPMIKYATTDNEIGIFPIKIGFDDIVKVLNAQPTVEAEPVRHGKWYVIPMTTMGKNPITLRMYRCSECKSTSYEKTPYCCRCGAKMDGRKKNETN